MPKPAVLVCRPEYARACGIEALEPLGVYLPGDKNYPGGLMRIAVLLRMLCPA